MNNNLGGRKIDCNKFYMSNDHIYIDNSETRAGFFRDLVNAVYRIESSFLFVSGSHPAL